MEQIKIRPKILAIIHDPVILAYIALLLIFSIDVFIPLGVSVGVLYLGILFLVCRQNKKTIIYFTYATCLLTVLKLILNYSEKISWMAYANRSISIATIILTAIFAIRHRYIYKTISQHKSQYIKSLENILKITSHNVRQPIAHCLGLIELLHSGNLSINETNKVLKLLKDSIIKLEIFTKRLTNYTCQSKRKFNNLRSKYNSHKQTKPTYKGENNQ